MDNMVCAIFADGKFVSWTYGAFMQLVEEPKIYKCSDEQIKIIFGNFNYKIKRLEEQSKLNFYNTKGNEIINAGQNADKYALLRHKNFELRVYRTSHTYETWVDDVDKDSPYKVFKYVEDN